MRHRWTLAASAALAVFVSAADAGAQPRRADDPVVQAATVHLQAATAAYGERRYDVAAREFEVAYELTSNTPLLFNAGSAWERVPDFDRALAAYRRFLERAPADPGAADVRARIAVLERTRPPTPALTPPTPSPRPVAPPVAAPRPDPGPPQTPVSHTWRTVGIAAGAGSVVLAGVAAGVYASASSDFDALQRTCAPRCAQSEAASVDRRATATSVLLGIAGAALALSAASFVIELTSNRRASAVSVAVTPIADGALAVLGGRL